MKFGSFRNIFAICALLTGILLFANTTSATTFKVDPSYKSDHDAIFEEPAQHLKEELEKTFFRDDLIVQWVDKMGRQYPSILYMVVVNSDNRQIHAYYSAKVSEAIKDVEDIFKKVDKLMLKEGMKYTTLGDLKMMVFWDKIVIEMDTYYFETGFGPMK